MTELKIRYFSQPWLTYFPGSIMEDNYSVVYPEILAKRFSQLNPWLAQDCTKAHLKIQ